jgi:uncharacterized protein (TIGR03435 family)
MRRTACPALLGIAFALGLCGQVTPSRPSFEVESVKVDTNDMVSDRVPHRSGNRVRMQNQNLYGLVIYAYDVKNYVYQLVNQPDRLFSDTRFDVDAIAPGEPSENDLRLMFQTLLENRFKLKVHWETRELAGYDLVAAKGGSKMKAASPDKKITLDGQVFSDLGTSQLFLTTNHVAHLIGKGSSMEQLTYQLTGRMWAPIRDRTGLTGTFDYDVIFALNDLQADANSAPILPTAIQEELGLKLEKSKIPVKVLIVDHAEKPSEN